MSTTEPPKIVLLLKKESEKKNKNWREYLERGWRREGSKRSFQPQSMRKLKPSMETKYDSGFSLYTPHTGVTCTEVPISLFVSLSRKLSLYLWKVVGEQAVEQRPFNRCLNEVGD